MEVGTKSKSPARECVTTHLTNAVASKMDDAQVDSPTTCRAVPCALLSSTSHIALTPGGSTDLYGQYVSSHLKIAISRDIGMSRKCVTLDQTKVIFFP